MRIKEPIITGLAGLNVLSEITFLLDLILKILKPVNINVIAAEKLQNIQKDLTSIN